MKDYNKLLFIPDSNIYINFKNNNIREEID